MNIEPGQRMLVRRQRAREAEPIPLSGQIHAELMGCARFHLTLRRRHREPRAYRFEKPCVGQSAEVANYTIVVKNSHLALRESDRLEGIVGLTSIVFRICFARGTSEARGGGRSVVAVGDVESSDAGGHF